MKFHYDEKKNKKNIKITLKFENQKILYILILIFAKQY